MSETARILPRPAPLEVGVLEELRAAGVATTHEASGRRGLLDPVMRPIQAGVAIAGSAVTVLTEPDDNLMIHAAVERCGPGDVLVVAVTSESRHGLIGELLATSLQARHVAGVILEGGVRDVAELRRMGFPVWSCLISARGSTKERAGSVNIAVTCAGQNVDPGDVIVADDDGVVRVAREEVSEVVERCRERAAAEAEKRAAFATGTLSLDLYGLRETLDRLGVVSPEAPSGVPRE